MSFVTRSNYIWAGLAGPWLFVTVFTLEGWFRPNYSVTELEVSALSLGSRGWIQILSFVLTGSCFVLFSSRLTSLLKYRRASRVAGIMIGLLGVGLILSGLFVMDPPNTPRDLWTWHGWIHRICGAVVFTLFPLSCFVFWWICRPQLHWRSFGRWSLLIGCLILVSISCMKVGQLQAADSFFAVRLGLFQRVVLILYMGWLFSLAWRLAKGCRMEPMT